MLCCNNCIINPICQIGCEKLLKYLNKITLRDFVKYKNLNKRLILVSQLIRQKDLVLDLKHNIKFKINNLSDCKFYKKDKLHREDGPAVECANGTKYWYINGELHREDGPAIEYANGTKYWYINNKFHREDGPAIEYANGTKDWWINGKRHREGGPAVEFANGSKEWYINGELHRVDGPAVEFANGTKYWFINGETPSRRWTSC